MKLSLESMTERERPRDLYRPIAEYEYLAAEKPFARRGAQKNCYGRPLGQPSTAAAIR